MDEGSDGHAEAKPAALPGLRLARTLYAALYGEFTPRPAGDGELSQDAYSLFYARSAAMGWLTQAIEGAQGGGLWGMNDAEAGPGLSPAAFFQVTLTEPAEGRLLPIQPFLACAGDVVARLGGSALRLDAVKVVLPEHDADADARFASPSSMLLSRALQDALDWFGDCGARVPARITLDGQADPSIRTVAPTLCRSMQEMHQEVFDCESWSEDDHLVLPPTVTFSGEDGHHLVTFRGTLAEWSLDALGWLAAFLADVTARHGVRTPLTVTAGRLA